MPCGFLGVYLVVLAFHSPAMADGLNVEVQFLEWQWKGARPPEPFFKDGEYQTGLVSSMERPPGAKVVASMTMSAEAGRPFAATSQIGNKGVAICGVVRKLTGDEVEIEIRPRHWQQKSPGRDESSFAMHLMLKVGKPMFMAGVGSMETNGSQGLAITVTKGSSGPKTEKNANSGSAHDQNTAPQNARPLQPAVPPQLRHYVPEYREVGSRGGREAEIKP